MTLEARLEGFRRWLRRENTRPLLGFSIGSYYPLRRYPRAAAGLPDGLIGPGHIVPSAYLEDTEELYHLHEAAGGDMLFSAAPFWGIPWMEAALGCGVHVDQAAGSMRSVPPAAAPELTFSAQNPWVAKMLEFIPLLERQSAGRYPVGVTLTRGISDLLAALHGAEGFVLRLHDEPEAMRRVIDRLADFWIAFGRCLLDRLPLFHGGTGVFAYGTWCPGRCIWLQEDAAALLSPRLYREFIWPADRRIARAFERTAVHLHPSRVLPVTEMMDAGIGIVEIHLDHDGPRAESLYSRYLGVLRRAPLLVWGDITEEDFRVLRTLPSQGLAVNAVVASVEQARRASES